MSGAPSPLRVSTAPSPTTLGELRASGYRPRAVKDEVRSNLLRKLRAGEDVFPGVLGYEQTVVPQIQNALLARHDIILLGLRGQAKSRIVRLLTTLLDEWVPVVTRSEIHDDPLAPVSRFARRLIEEHGDDTPVSWLHRSARYGEKLATPDTSIADLIGDIDPIKAATRKLTYADEEVILVDAADQPLGRAGKLEAHRDGRLHRAFSVIVHDGKGNLLLQKRHRGKYHSGGLWTNTCCGHPRPGESTVAAARRRLREEMGVDCDLSPAGTLRYRASVGSGMIEHEIDHLFVGVYGGRVEPNPAEVSEVAWVDLAELADRRRKAPGTFSAWFFPVLDELTRLAILPVATTP